MADQSHAVEDILDQLEQKGEENGSVSVGDMTDALGHRGHGPFLFVPALLEISPIGGIPGVPTLLALIVALFAVQIVLGHEQMWLPDFLERRTVKGDRLKSATEKLEGLAAWLDRWFHGRFEMLTGRTATRIAAIAVLLLCLTVPPLELVPFASSAPMAAIVMFGLAMTLRDGLVMALGYLFSVVAVGIGLGLLGGG